MRDALFAVRIKYDKLVVRSQKELAERRIEKYDARVAQWNATFVIVICIWRIYIEVFSFTFDHFKSCRSEDIVWKLNVYLLSNLLLKKFRLVCFTFLEIRIRWHFNLLIDSLRYWLHFYDDIQDSRVLTIVFKITCFSIDEINERNWWDAFSIDNTLYINIYARVIVAIYWKIPTVIVMLLCTTCHFHKHTSFCV